MPKEAQTYKEMVEDGIAKRSSRVFSVKNADENDLKISELVNSSVEELARAADEMDTISLSDTTTLKRRTLIYVRACSDAGTLPTFSGLMRSLGLTARAGYQHNFFVPFNYFLSKLLQLSGLQPFTLPDYLISIAVSDLPVYVRKITEPCVFTHTLAVRIRIVELVIISVCGNAVTMQSIRQSEKKAVSVRPEVEKVYVPGRRKHD